MRPRWHRMTAAMIVLSMILLMMGIGAGAAPISGAIFTTDADGSTNVNSYTSREDVYLNGGPQKEGSAGLPDGSYYCKVTTSSGDLLGTSASAFIVVTGGSFAQSYHLWTYFQFAVSPNGVYKVWVSKSSSFPSAESKTDNFKVTEDFGWLAIEKFHDYDADGSKDAGEPLITGWEVTINDGESSWVRTTPVSIQLPVGMYSVTEADGGDWWRVTTPGGLTQTGIVVTRNATTTVVFGNVQLGKLTVTKFNDLDGDGVKDAEEPAITGWDVTVSGPDAMHTGPHKTPWTAYVLPGTYTITEAMPAGWSITYGVNPANVTIAAGQATEVIFGNHQTFATCTNYSQGYWKNHVDMWPAGNYTAFFDSGMSWLQVLKMAPKGDAYFILAHQWIAAHLNMHTDGTCTPPQCVLDAYAAGGDYFEHNLPGVLVGGKLTEQQRELRADLLEWAECLEAWNTGGADAEQTMARNGAGRLGALENVIGNPGRAAEVIQKLLDGRNPGNKPAAAPGKAK